MKSSAAARVCIYIPGTAPLFYSINCTILSGRYYCPSLQMRKQDSARFRPPFLQLPRAWFFHKWPWSPWGNVLGRCMGPTRNVTSGPFLAQGPLGLQMDLGLRRGWDLISVKSDLCLPDPDLSGYKSLRARRPWWCSG